ncbi:hypothetical protein CDD83_10469 [Cordyceps sp. RAO-2017]|nr:hypothetical protein CDD83_10469 [Cordyceps sp. RAO-2017]
MAIQFCSHCGDTLPESRDATVQCTCCGSTSPNTVLGAVSRSSSSDFPSELRRRRTIRAPERALAPTDTWSATDVACPRCRAPEVRYTALQLRSADEGTTMFYACPACALRWNEDN